MTGSGAVLSQAGAGTGDGVLAYPSLDRTIGAGEKGRATVLRGEAVREEVRARKIIGSGGWTE